MAHTDTPKPRTCKRCKGTGEYRSYGICYGCSGRGVIIPAAPAVLEADAEYRRTTLEPRARREAERKARQEARR